MKIQVIGARGMLGQQVVLAAQRAGVAVHASAGDLLSCPIQGDVVINCAGIVKQRTELPDSYFLMVNGYGPQRLAEACDVQGARLIQVSSDCVFAGPGPHSESDAPNGRGIYAVSKLAGEVTRAPHLTIRTSFVGIGRRGLIADLMAQRGQAVSASINALWTGHTAPTIARLLVQLAVERPDVTGLLHVPGQEMSRPQLIQCINEAFELGLTVDWTHEPGEDRRLWGLRWLQEFGLRLLPPFAEQLQELKA